MTITETVQDRARSLVEREVFYCVSGLINDLANHSRGAFDDDDELMALCGPAQDYEEAAIQAGFIRQANGKITTQSEAGDDQHEWDSWQEACDSEGIEPYDREIYEHWIVSDWLADKLAEKGEVVARDFHGLTVWGRPTTGQAIYCDGVIEAITRDLYAVAP